MYRKTCVKQLLKKDKKMIFKTNNRLVQVKSTAECSKGSILQHFCPLLNYRLSLRYKLLFCLFLSGPFPHRIYCNCAFVSICHFINLRKKLNKIKKQHKILLTLQGWALYSEALGEKDELDIYKDDYEL